MTTTRIIVSQESCSRLPVNEQEAQIHREETQHLAVAVVGEAALCSLLGPKVALHDGDTSFVIVCSVLSVGNESPCAVKPSGQGVMPDDKQRPLRGSFLCKISFKYNVKISSERHKQKTVVVCGSRAQDLSSSSIAATRINTLRDCIALLHGTGRDANTLSESTGIKLC